MNKQIKLSEVESDSILKKIDQIKEKPSGFLIDEKVFNEPNKNSVYKFVKASKNNNIFIKKLEILSKSSFKLALCGFDVLFNWINR